MKTNQSLSFAIIVTFLIIVGCSTEKRDKSENPENPNYSLVKVDSFQVNNFTRVNIRDYSPIENIYLGYSLTEDDILEISESGEILKRVHKKGDGPGNYGSWNPTGLGFGPDSLRIVELPFQVIAYSPDYEIIHSHRIMSPLPIRANSPLGIPPFYQKNDTTLFLVGPSNYITASNLIYNQEGKDTLQNFYQLNLLTGDVKSVIPYESNSIYNSTQGVYMELMGKSFFVDSENNELVLVQGLDPEILIYDLKDLSLKNRIPITYSEFLTYDPVPIGTRISEEIVLPLRRLAAKNQKLMNLGDGIYLLQYFTGITEAEFENRNSEDEPYSASLDTSEQRILIFKDGKQLNLELPGLDGLLITSLPGKRLLVQEPENKEVEEEFTKFSIYQLTTN
ncbi:hypothetical protein AAGF08_03125 [Algoriphagus sp. SE2]|uniref:hypothetical protein n=1 Tax=Algoriphagus sp. SE2 TaxID=3141536 RepID=UPI0031CD7A2A